QIAKSGFMSESAIRHAIAATENGFIEAVRNAIETQPLMALEGCCCVIGVIWRSRLYVANLGDSRAVLGHSLPTDSVIVTVLPDQLTVVHNVNEENVRRELLVSHSLEAEPIITKDKGLHLIKNRIQVSRSIGDAYLKYPELALPDIPIKKALLKAEPTMLTRDLQEYDKFLIFASGSLWEHLSNEEAVEFVQTHPAKGIAKRLVEEAQSRAAARAGISFRQVKRAAVGKERRWVHDDITVVVIFLDYKLLSENSSGNGRFNLVRTPHAQLDESTIGFSDKTSQSKFHHLRHLTVVEGWPPLAASEFPTSYFY
ncbi:putative protein phosphatase 2C 25, partial [Bienertia sinuspersici]